MPHPYVPASPASSALWRRLKQLWSEEADEFLVLSAAGPNAPERPLLVLVHPGDSTEEPEDGGRDIAKAAFGLQELMAGEIEGMLDSHDLVVLHRQSSHYGLARAKNVCHRFVEQIERIHDRGTVLYGDDLDEAAQWLVDAMGADRRPAVFLTGAWSHPEYGCVTAVGKALLQAGAAVTVSPWSPVEPGSTDGQWAPERSAAAPGPR